MKWQCARCTLLNLQKATKCDACQAERPPVRVAISGQTISETIAAREREVKRQACEEQRARSQAAAVAKAAERSEVGRAEAQCTLKEFLEDHSNEFRVPSTDSTMSKQSSAQDWEWTPAKSPARPDKKHGIGTLRRPMPAIVDNLVGRCHKCNGPWQSGQIYCTCGVVDAKMGAQPKRKSKAAEKNSAWATCVPDGTPWASINEDPRPPGFRPPQAAAVPQRNPYDIQSDFSQQESEKRPVQQIESSDGSEDLFPSQRMAPPSPEDISSIAPEPPSNSRIREASSVEPEDRSYESTESERLDVRQRINPRSKKTGEDVEKSTLVLGDLYSFFCGAAVIILVGMPQSGKSTMASALERYAGFRVMRRDHEQKGKHFLQSIDKHLQRANKSGPQLRLLRPRLVIDAEHLTKKDRADTWELLVEKHGMNPYEIRFLVFVPTRQTCKLYIERLMIYEEWSYEDAEKKIRDLIRKKFEPISKVHLPSPVNVLTVLNDIESDIVRTFVKHRSRDLYSTAYLRSPQKVRGS